MLARKNMLCPFSDRACKNCSLYIGRHYRLCNKPGYRGHIEDKAPEKDSGPYQKRNMVVPEFDYIEELDPYIRME